MPQINYYEKPDVSGDTNPRPLEFWKNYRGGTKSTFISVPSSWSDAEILSELEDWCDLENHTSFVRYGWNDEKDFGSRV